jgi:ABC-type uncharacterized transport system auxiliary subunit
MIKIVTLIFFFLICNSCTFSLIPNQNNIKFYDLSLTKKVTLPNNICIAKTEKQILLKNIKISSPYDGLYIFILKEDGSLIKLKDAQWISSLNTLYENKLDILSSTSCESSGFIPIISTDLSTNTDEILSINLIKAEIEYEKEIATTEVNISMVVRSEKTGEIIKTINKKTIEKIEKNTNEISSLKRSIEDTTIKCLQELRQ